MSTPRIEKLRHDPEPQFVYERWGPCGRPIMLLNDPERDRSAWWPVAAALADHHAVMVLDLPEGPGPEALAEDLALLIHQTGTRAPVLVGHASAALVASVFALRYVAHAVVNVQQRLDLPAGDAELDRALRAITEGPKPIQSPYLSVFATEPEPGYAAWLGQRVPKSRCEAYETPGGHPHLEVMGRFVTHVREMAA